MTDLFEPSELMELSGLLTCFYLALTMAVHALI